MKKIFFAFVSMVFTGLPALFNPVNATIWQVGPAGVYTVPSSVASLVNDNDTVEIDAGDYTGDCAAWTKNNLVLRGVGGIAHLEANGNYVWGKGTWVMAGNNTTVEYIEFSGAAVPDHNGAGIRLDGEGLTVRYCYFHDNENGILGGAAGDILIEYSEFAHNGYGDGYTHNIYINNAESFTLKFCYMHHAVIGHEVKSRAHKNFILYNRIMNESDGTASHEIDLPNGGQAIIIGNLIQQGPDTENGTIFAYGLEGLINNPPHEIYLINNTFVDERGYNGIFISIPAGVGLLKAYNNIFAGGPASFITNTPTITDTLSNLIVPDKTQAGLVNIAAYDYHLLAGSPAVDNGADPGFTGSFHLSPVAEYQHPSDSLPRITYGTIDIGAYEYQWQQAVGDIISKRDAIQVIYLPNEEKLIIRSGFPADHTAIYELSGMIIANPVQSSVNTWEMNCEKISKGIYCVVAQFGKCVITGKFGIY